MVKPFFGLIDKWSIRGNQERTRKHSKIEESKPTCSDYISCISKRHYILQRHG